MIYLGPAGIPIVSKERSTASGIRTVAELGLNAMEVEFVHGINMSIAAAKGVGEIAKDLHVKLSIHCPYAINLSSKDKKVIEASKQRIFDSATRATELNASPIVFHPGYYMGQSPETAYSLVKQACESLVDKMKENGIKNVLLGLETTGKVSQFGTLDELVKLCSETKGCMPALDPAHIFARQAGKIDYDDIFEKMKPLNLEHIHMHFSGIKWRPAKPAGGNEWYHVEIKTDQPPFEPLAKEVLKRKADTTIICESPALEHDSLVMKKTFDKLGCKL
jgi:deoxyribonuclease-4